MLLYLFVFVFCVSADTPDDEFTTAMDRVWPNVAPSCGDEQQPTLATEECQFVLTGSSTPVVTTDKISKDPIATKSAIATILRPLYDRMAKMEKEQKDDKELLNKLLECNKQGMVYDSTEERCDDAKSIDCGDSVPFEFAKSNTCGTDTSYHAKCEVLCTEDFMEGTTYATCGMDGKWKLDDVSFECVPRTCSVPVPPNMNLGTCAYAINSGHSCSLACSKEGFGYSTQDGGLITCMPDGNTTALKEECVEVCGDGKVVGSEVCDTGEADSTGCENCQEVTKGYLCALPGNACKEICGDGILTPTEQCDDNNTKMFDGCSSSCNVETNWHCKNEEGKISQCDGVCGDKVTKGTEECDGVLGCDTDCTSKDGYKCAGGKCQLRMDCKGLPNGIHTISPMGANGPSLKAKCFNGFYIMDVVQEPDWRHFLNNPTTYGSGHSAIFSPSLNDFRSNRYLSWKEFFRVTEKMSSTKYGTFGMSDNCDKCHDVGKTPYATGNYQGCLWYNRRCPMVGNTCRRCSGYYGNSVNWGYCTHMPRSPVSAYRASATVSHWAYGNCNHWWNNGPAIGRNSHNCVCYKLP
eukprot:m.13130 g.13130  ORF g.13130 m.13130 type:complete len:578 (-) comp4795_c0_seq1:43-1776(-)